MKECLTINVVADNLNSWIIPFATDFVEQLRKLGHSVNYIHHHTYLIPGDIAFYLGCQNIVSADFLALNQHNLVVHESALPAGKGWSPLTWQILEGKNEIPITLFEAVESVDAGVIYYQDMMKFAGHELVDELRQVQGQKTIALCLRFVNEYPNVTGHDQQGEASFYPRRRPKDSEIDINQPLIELFNQFRVADNERYPVFFHHLGHKYILKIEKA